MSKKDGDAAFIFLWIAFNAAYASDCVEPRLSGERSAFEDYFDKLIALDGSNRIYDAIWRRFSGPIRVLLDNRYVFQPFWNHQNQVSGYGDWEERFTRSKTRISKALAQHDTKTILTTVVGRLYVLRNQLVHGGATWNSSVNRAQVSAPHWCVVPNDTVTTVGIIPSYTPISIPKSPMETGSTCCRSAPGALSGRVLGPPVHRTNGCLFVNGGQGDLPSTA